MGFDLRLLDLTDTQLARRELEAVGADPAGVAKMVPKSSSLSIKACGLKAPGANILKQEMLSLGGEVAVSRGVINCSVERTDVLVLGTRKQVRSLIRKLRPQPFGLKSLAGELEELLERLGWRYELPWREGVLELWKRPHVMGVVNVTPDSFSDGGDYLEADAAVDRAIRMVEEGADILDLGGESSRPGAEPIPEEEELQRILPVLERLVRRVGVPLSVDTYRSGVARRAVEAGASLINDISGLSFDPALAGVAAEGEVPLVLMHMRGTPKTMQTDTRYDDLVGEVHRSLRHSVERAEAAGVARERIVVDPGIGFGKSAEGNLVLLKRLGELRSLGCPILVGASRKTFIGRILDIPQPKDRLEGSLAAAVIAVWNGAHIVRAHDVKETRRAVDLAWAIRSTQEG